MIYYEYNQIKYSIINERARTARTGYGENNLAITSDIIGQTLKIPSQSFINDKYYYVTEIGKASFYNCCNIYSLFIPYTIEIIREQGFEAMKNCKEIIFEENSHLKTIEYHGFYDFYNLESLSFSGNCLTTIKNNVFKYGLVLKNITFPSSVVKIGSESLGSLSIIENIFYCSKNEIIGDNVFFSYNSPEMPKTNSNLKIYVTSDYPSNRFGERSIDFVMTKEEQQQYCPELSSNCNFLCTIMKCNDKQIIYNHYIVIVLLVRKD